MKTQLIAWVDGDMKEKAKELRINMSQLCDKALRKTVMGIEKWEHDRTKDVLQTISKVITEEEKRHLIKILKKPYQELTDEDINFLDSVDDKVNETGNRNNKKEVM